MINRDTILDLSTQAQSEGNSLLRYLLLTVAGMMEPDGSVTGWPFGHEKWDHVAGVDGAMGRGLALQQRRNGGATIAPPTVTSAKGKVA